MAQADWQRVSLPWDCMVAIDGGLSGTGIVLFERDANRVMQPVKAEVFTPKKSMTYMQKAFAIGEHLRAWYLQPMDGPSRQVHGVIEFPAYQEGAARQMGWKTGDLQKLTYLVGYLTGALPWNRMTHVLPRDWKGQLPKDVVERRLIRDLGVELCASLGVKTHGWDALGIGLHVLGRFGPTVQNPLPASVRTKASSSPAPSSPGTRIPSSFRVPRASATTSSGGPRVRRIVRR